MKHGGITIIAVASALLLAGCGSTKPIDYKAMQRDLTAAHVTLTGTPQSYGATVRKSICHNTQFEDELFIAEVHDNDPAQEHTTIAATTIAIRYMCPDKAGTWAAALAENATLNG